MLKISEKDDKIIIEGKGTEFLRIKNKLIELLSDSQITHYKKGTLSFPKNLYYLAEELLEDQYNTFSDEFNKQKKQNIIAHTDHYTAKQTIESIIEQGIAKTGNTFWDEILDPQQATAVSAMIVEGLLGLCLFDEQGSGKTIMSLAAFDILNQKDRVKQMIIIGPKSMTEEWKNAFNDFIPGKYSIRIMEGGITERANTIQTNPDVLIMNYESVKPHLAMLKAYASKAETLYIVDESFYVKNKQTQRTSAITELRQKCVLAYCLCGTPAPNSPFDIISQFDVADGGFTFSGVEIPKDKERAVEIITNQIEEKGIFIRRLKTELLPDLPEKLFKIIKVPLSGRQAFLYEKTRNELVLYLKHLDNTQFKKQLGTYFQKRAALLQICIDPQLIDPLYSETPAKYTAFDDLAKKLISEEGKKIVVWSYYRRTLDKLEGRVKQYSPVRIDGSVTLASLRRKAVKAFQNDQNTKLFLANPAAAGAGITLHSASDSIYLSYSNQAVHFLQSLDRIHRRGQTAEEVNYYLFVAEKTIEENEIIRLRHKELKQQDLLKDDVSWPSSIDDAIDELGG